MCFFLKQHVVRCSGWQIAVVSIIYQSKKNRIWKSSCILIHLNSCVALIKTNDCPCILQLFYFPLSDNLLVLRCIYFECDSLSLNMFSSRFPTHGWEFRSAPHTLGCVQSEGTMTFFLLRRRSWKHLNVTGRRSPSGWECVYVSSNLTPEAKSHLNCNKNITRHDISIIWLAPAGFSLQMLHLNRKQHLYSHFWADLTKFSISKFHKSVALKSNHWNEIINSYSSAAELIYQMK